MLIRVCFGLALLIATPVWAQLESTPFETATTATDTVEMKTPPPVSGEAYPTTVRAETYSNYLNAGLVFNSAYDDNVLGGASSTPVGDFTYTIFPTITLDQSTPRQHLTLTYSPGFTFYQHTSTLNSTDQNATVNFQYRLSEHISVSVRDLFQKSSNIFNQPYPLTGGPISGSPQSLPAGVIAPYADRLSNTANADISYQFSRNRMIGGGGFTAQLSYPHPAEASGLSNSDSRGGSAFYNQRLSSTQYAGVTYLFVASQTNPVDTQGTSSTTQSYAQTNTIMPFYTVYLTPTLSFSLSGGPQHFSATQFLSLPVRSWVPSALASIGWQGNQVNLAASYSKTVTGGAGLPGAFSSNNANVSALWLVSRTWKIGSAANYSIITNVTPLFISSSPGGHTVSGTLSVQRSLSEHFKAEFGYTRLHQSYSGIAVISNAPDTNREYISISYQFRRPLGR
jgi:hypothetical protein